MHVSQLCSICGLGGLCCSVSDCAVFINKCAAIISPCCLQDQYIEITTSAEDGAALYGLGERTSSTGLELPRDGVPLALWNRDSQASDPDQNVYGSHPILIEVRPGEREPSRKKCGFAWKLVWLEECRVLLREKIFKNQVMKSPLTGKGFAILMVSTLYRDTTCGKYCL